MNYLFYSITLALLFCAVVQINGAIYQHQLIRSTTLKEKPAGEDDSHKLEMLKKGVDKLQKYLKTHFEDKQPKEAAKRDAHAKPNGQSKTKKAKKGQASIGTATLLDYEQDYYLLNISLGTPRQWFLVQPQMFSSDFWVIDSECQDKACVGALKKYKRNLFDKSKSSSFRSTDETIEVEYDYDATVVNDKLTLGGLVARQYFALASEVENYYAYEPMDGVMGLGSYPNNIEGTLPVVQSLKPDLDEPVFSVFVGRHNSKKTHGGLITFGGKDKDNCEADWSYTYVNNHTQFAKYWEFQIGGYTIANASKTIDNHRKRSAVVFLGLGFIAGPPANVQSIAQTAGFHFNKTYGVWLVDCTAIRSLPELQFKVGDAQVVVTGKQYTAKYTVKGEDICLLKIVGINAYGGPAWYLGDNLLSGYCTSFEISTGTTSQTASNAVKVGFAKAKFNENIEDED